VDPAEVLELRKAGLTGREIAVEMGIAEVTVWRNLKKR
jgi:hypothetical protein